MRPGLWLLGVLALGCRPAEVAGSAVAPVRRAPTYEVRRTRGVPYARARVRDSWEAPQGQEVDLELDVWEPRDAPSPRPAVLCIPGGGFEGSLRAPARSVLYSRDKMAEFAQFLAQRGFVAFSVQYRLAGDHGASPPGWPSPPKAANAERWRSFYPATHDVKAALRWIHAEAERYGVSGDHVALLGGSGGGAIAVALATSDPDDFSSEVESPGVASGRGPRAHSDVAAALVCWASDVPARAITAYDGRDRFDAGDAPLCIVHGRDDVIVPFGAGQRLYERCRRAGMACELRAFDGGHAAWDARIDGRPLTEVAFDWFVRTLELEVQ